MSDLHKAILKTHSNVRTVDGDTNPKCYDANGNLVTDIDMDKVSDDDIMAAMRHAHDKVEYQDHNAMLDEIHEWLLEIKNERNK